MKKIILGVVALSFITLSGVALGAGPSVRNAIDDLQTQIDNIILPTVGPQGEQGEQGPQGPIGLQGPRLEIPFTGATFLSPSGNGMILGADGFTYDRTGAGYVKLEEAPQVPTSTQNIIQWNPVSNLFIDKLGVVWATDGVSWETVDIL